MGPYRTQIVPASTMSATDVVTPTLSIEPDPTGSTALKVLGCEIANMRIAGTGGYSGLYLGDSSAGSANASGSVVHNCIIDGANLEGLYGIVIRGGSFINIVNNIITGWATAAVVIAAGATRTAYANIVDRNHIIRNSGTAVALQYKSDCNNITANYITDSATALTFGVNTAAVGLFGACTGADNGIMGNYFCTTGTAISCGANDHAAGNYERSAGNAATAVKEE